MGGRVQQVVQLERLFAAAPMRVLGPLGAAHRGFNGVPKLVEVWDEAAGLAVPAIHKPASAQAPQEAFASRVIHELGADDLFAVTAQRKDPLDGYLVEQAQGRHPATLAHLLDGLRARHAGAPDPERLARIDLHRIIGVDWVLGNADRHFRQLSITPTGVLGYDQGHLGYRLTRTGSSLTVPMHPALLGRQALSATTSAPGSLRLEQAAVDSLLAHVRPAEIARAHAETLASWRGPVHPNFGTTSRFAASSEYLDGVLERLRHLQQTGTIRFVNVDSVA